MLGGAPAAPVVVDLGPQPTKPMIKPGKKMKALHWKAILVGEKSKRTDDAKNSIWVGLEALHDQLVKKLDTALLEEKFSSAPIKKPLPSGGADKPAAEQKAASDGKPQRVLDPKRHEQLSIMLSKMPKLPAMKQAILALDGTKLTADQVDSLHKNLFTSEEVEFVKGCGIAPAQLQLPEQWILELSTVPQLSARLECWRFSQTFDDLYADVDRPLDLLQRACAQVRKSEALKKTMAAVLAVGNYLNGGTPRGQADGFQMESLSKLARLKDAKGQSLLEHIAELLAKQFGTDFASTLRQELELLGEVKTLALKSVSAEARKLSGKTRLVLKMRSLVGAQAGGSGDAFEKVLGKFLDAAEDKVKKLEDKAKDAFETFVSLMLYLEPDLGRGKAEQQNTEEFFVLLEEFVDYVYRSYEESRRQKAADAAAQKQAVHLAELKKAMARKPAPQAAK
jgi:formin 2